jgi:nucleoside-diphosphate-sugar epimerase
MKIALTGHTSGLGECMYRHFDVDCAFSRSNGYDLLEEHNRARMLEEIEHCDVFINNAFPGYAADQTRGMDTQLDILYRVYSQWENQNKLIVHLGSNTTDGIKSHVWPYAAAKAASDKACEQLSYLKTGPSVCNIRFGYIDLPHINAIAPEEKKIPVATALNTVQHVIDTFAAGSTVREITVIP